MKHAYQILMRLFAIFGIVVFCVILLYVIAVTWGIPIHNYRLWVLQKNFRSTVQPLHPAQSQLRAEMAEFGNFGNSNHCDYMVGEFRSSSLSKEAVMRAYAGAIVPSFSSHDKNSPLPVEVYFTDEDIFHNDYTWSEWLSKYLSRKPATSDKNTYLVFTSSDMHPPDGDIRCH